MASTTSKSNQAMQLAYDDLRGWMAEADRLGELKTVLGAGWEEDIGLAAELVSHDENAPAVVFDEVPGSPKGFRLLSNLFGGRRRPMTLGFPDGLNKVELSDAFADAFDPDGARVPPVFVENGPVLENSLTGEAVDLELFPTPLWHADDGGRYIGTGSYNITQDPDTGWVNLGCYRIMLRDKTSVTYNTAPGRHGKLHHEKYIARGEKMPVVMVLGGDPMTFFMAGIEIADGVSEFDVVGGIRGRPIELVRGPATGLPFPADAEIALEGFVDPKKLVPEGPFGDWTGTYTEPGRIRPLTEVVAIHHRTDPVLLGFPPQSLPDEYSRLRAVMRSALVKRGIEAAGVPDVTGVWAHEVGGSRMLIGVSIKQRYPGHGRQAGHVAAFCHAGAHSAKWIIVVDDDVDVSDLEALIAAALVRSDPATSTDFSEGGWTSPADPRVHPDDRAAGKLVNSRMIIDACVPFHWRDDFSASTAASPDAIARAREKFGWLLD